MFASIINLWKQILYQYVNNLIYLHSQDSTQVDALPQNY